MSLYNFKQDHPFSASRSTEDREFVESWIVTSPVGAAIDDDLILAERPIWTPGESHPTKTGARVSDFRVRQEGEHNIGKAEITYIAPKLGDRTERPLSLPPEISIRSATLQIPTLFDVEGKPLLNTAGDFITGITRPMSVWVIQVKMNVASVPRWILNYGDAVNNATVRLRGIDFPKKTLKLVNIDIPDSVYDKEANQEYIPLTLEIHYRADTWVEKYPNKGLYEIDRVEDPENEEEYIENKKRIMTSDGTPVSTPQFLNRSGYQIRDRFGRVKTRLDPEDIVTLEFKTLNERSFTTLLSR